LDARTRQLALSTLSAVDPQALAVVIVTYNCASYVGETLAALAPQLRPDDELVVVDNASRDGTVEAVTQAAPGARVVRQNRNLGFAGGCNTGAASGVGPLILFLNPDARPAPGCLDALRATAHERPRWGAWQALVTMRGGGEINTAGNVVHFLGVSWAGLCRESLARAPREPVEVGYASGTALVVRREAWEQLGGFDERYFMYCEDLDLGLRLWLSGRGVGVAPSARVEHDYAFHKGAGKWFLLERNRWWTVLATYPGSLLVLLLPALIATEGVMLVTAARHGWLRQKLRAQAAVACGLPATVARRRSVQSRRQVSAAAFARHLSADLDNPYLGGLVRVKPLAAAQRLYWRLVLGLLGGSGADASPS
jgi:N-acetylglucosaminyl-diphospho-decaprenol L-rhamnosyltransferase